MYSPPLLESHTYQNKIALATMSQYSSFLATAPITPVPKSVSSPESTRQFGNPPQLAQPWVIFRRPSKTRYTAAPGGELSKVETQLLEGHHNHTATSFMSPVMLEVPNSPHADYVFTTTSEETMLARISTTPETTPYVHTDVRTNTKSTEITFFEPSTSPEMTYEVPKCSNKDIDCLCDIAISVEIAPLKSSTKSEVPNQDIGIRSDLTCTEITRLGISTKLELTLKVSERSNQNIHCISDGVMLVENDPPRHAETTKRPPGPPSHDVDCVFAISPLEITPLRSAETAECVTAPPKLSNRDIDHISDVTSAETTLLGPSANQESIFEASKSPDKTINCISNITSVEITKNFPELPTFLNQDIGSRSVRISLLTPATKLQFAQAATILPYQEIEPHYDTSFSEINPSSNSKTSSNQNAESSSDPTLIDAIPRMPSASLEFTGGVCDLSNQDSDCVSETRFSEITPAESSANSEPVSSASKILNNGINHPLNSTSDITPVRLSLESRLMPSFPNLSSQNTESNSSTPMVVIPCITCATPDIMPTTSKTLNQGTGIGSDNTIPTISQDRMPYTEIVCEDEKILASVDLTKSNPPSNTSGSITPVQLDTNYPNHPRRRSLPRKPVSTGSSFSASVLRLPPANSGEDKKGHTSANPKRPVNRFSGSALHLLTEEQDDARKRLALAAGRLERAPNVRMPASSKFRGISVIPSRTPATSPGARSTNQMLSTMSEINEEETEDSKTAVMQTITNRLLPRESASQKLSGSFRFSGSNLHLPSVDEVEERKRHALAAGRLAPSVRRSVQPVPRLQNIRMSSHPAGTPVKANKAQRRTKVASFTLAVMSEVEEEEVAAQAECNPTSEVEEKAEETAAVVTTGPREPPTDARRGRAIVWRELDNIAEEEEGEEEPAATTQKDLKEAPVVNDEGQGGDLVSETPGPEATGEESAGIEPAETPPPRHTQYQTPTRWSSRIGEMRAARKPSYGWETAPTPDVSRAELMPAHCSASPAREKERVRYPAPMRWSSRIGEVRAARTLGYAGAGILFPLPPQANTPEAQDLGVPEGGADAYIPFGDLPLFPGLILEAILAPQPAESSSNSGESSGSRGMGATMGGSIKHRVRAAWKKVEGWGRIGGRAFSGGRG